MSRSASHAGSWYEDNGAALRSQLDGWLQRAPLSIDGQQRVKAIISPHAGYSYSGATAAYGFKHLDPNQVRRIFILGPSHHYYTRICELTSFSKYITPLDTLTIDHDVVQQLQSEHPALFHNMTPTTDEEEHSIEMQLPYIAHRMRGVACKIVPILVGNLSASKEREFGIILSRYFTDPATFFVISSDFCHWGRRFQCQPYNVKDGEIWQSIEKLDRRGMEIIERQDAEGFNNYIQETGNTICGKHPIAVLLHLLRHLSSTSSLSTTLRFIHYTQSSKCKNMNDSSVSYASAIVTVPA